MDGIDISYADTPTLAVSMDFRSKNPAARMKLVQGILGDFAVDVLTVTTEGRVTLKFHNEMKADVRGALLASIENCLKCCLDPGITVWLEPKGDRNALRKLRGIEVKR